MGIVSRTLSIFIQILVVLILARILSSWFRPKTKTRNNGWFFVLDEIVWRATEPFLAPIRNLLPSGGMGFDFSPMILLLIVQFVGEWLVQVLRSAGL